MTDIAQFVVPEGWYHDPAGAPVLRWWDGVGWTEHTVAEPAHNRPESRAEARIREGRHARSATRSSSTTHSASGPAANRPESTDLPSRRELRAQWNAVSARELGPEPPASVGPTPMPRTHPTFFTPPHVDRAEVVAAPAKARADGVTLAPLSAAALEAFMARAEAELADLSPATSARPSLAETFSLTAPMLGAEQLPMQTFEPTAVHETLPPAADEFTDSSPPANQSAFSHLTAVPERGTFVPFATQSAWRAEQVDRPDIVNTLSAWVLALIPLLYPITMILVIFALDIYVPAVQLGIAAIFVLWMVVLAVRDARELRASRHVRVASPAWILLSPFAYLIARGIAVQRQTGRGFGPLILLSVASAVEIALVVASPILLTFWK